MTHYISFGDQLDEKLKPILEKAGFKLVRRQIFPSEVLVYERQQPSTSMPDRIVFHSGGEENSQHIYCEVLSGLKRYTFLKTLKEFLPEFLSLGYPEYNRWAYSTVEDLKNVIDEIANLVEGKLLDWLQNPVLNPFERSKVIINKEDTPE
jgi:hypothetical protein